MPLYTDNKANVNRILSKAAQQNVYFFIKVPKLKSNSRSVWGTEIYGPAILLLPACPKKGMKFLAERISQHLCSTQITGSMKQMEHIDLKITIKKSAMLIF